MKASKLITRLNELIDDFGDREVHADGIGDPVTDVDHEVTKDDTWFMVTDYEKEAS